MTRYPTEGARISAETGKSVRQHVIDAGVAEAMERGVYQEGDDTLIGLEANREMNMVGGRPSDCARSAVGAYLRDPEGFRKDFHKARF